MMACQKSDFSSHFAEYVSMVGCESRSANFKKAILFFQAYQFNPLSPIYIYDTAIRNIDKIQVYLYKRASLK